MSDLILLVEALDFVFSFNLGLKGFGCFYLSRENSNTLCFGILAGQVPEAYELFPYLIGVKENSVWC